MNADLILNNGRIYTVDPTNPWVEAVACANGRILAAGHNRTINALAAPTTQMVDLQGRLVLPGLIDAHVHLLSYAIRQHQVDLLGVGDFEEVRARLRQAVAEARPGQWIQGSGWDENLWEIKPDRTYLDDIAPDNPVALRRIDGHSWWVNSAALAVAGVTRETADPPESQIERDPAGEPTGILREWNAIRLVEPYVPSPDMATQQIWLQEVIAEAHRLGLTGIHDQRLEREGRDSLILFQRLRRQGELKLRVHLNIAADYLGEAATLGLQPGFGDDHLWLGHIKAFADGTMGSRTALMLDPFEGEPNNYGVAVTPAEELWELARQSEQAGFPLSIHAIGDRAIRDVLGVLGELHPPEPSSPISTIPHRIEHVQIIHPDDLGRLHQHQIVASMQPVHLLYEWATTDRVWGQRARYAYAFRSLLDQGTRLAFGSDAPVAPLDPILGIYAAVTRQDWHGQPQAGWYPEERLSMAETIYGYTMGPAHLSGKQHVQGSITPGKWADMIVLSRNLFEIPPAEILETKVELTVFNGQIV